MGEFVGEWSVELFRVQEMEAMEIRYNGELGYVRVVNN